MGVPILQGFHAGLDDVFGRLEIRFADFQVDYLASLGFQGAGFGEDLESGFGAQATHASGYSHGQTVLG